MIYFRKNLAERNYLLGMKKLCKDTRKINKLKKAKLSEDQLRNLLERKIISIKE